MSEIENAGAMDQLSRTGRLVVRAYRHWVIGLKGQASEHWALVWNELAREFGPVDGGAAMSAFAALVFGLMRAAPHTLYHHQPRCPCLCTDECRLLALIDACQRGAWIEARAVAAELVEEDAVGDLLDAGARFALAMSRQGRHLSDRSPAGPNESREWPAAPSRLRH